LSIVWYFELCYKTFLVTSSSELKIFHIKFINLLKYVKIENFRFHEIFQYNYIQGVSPSMLNHYFFNNLVIRNVMLEFLNVPDKDKKSINVDHLRRLSVYESLRSL